jgi:hypothetical protein
LKTSRKPLRKEQRSEAFGRTEPENVKGPGINEQKDKPTTKKYLRNKMRYKKTVGLWD